MIDSSNSTIQELSNKIKELIDVKDIKIIHNITDDLSDGIYLKDDFFYKNNTLLTNDTDTISTINLNISLPQDFQIKFNINISSLINFMNKSCCLFGIEKNNVMYYLGILNGYSGIYLSENSNNNICRNDTSPTQYAANLIAAYKNNTYLPCQIICDNQASILHASSDVNCNNVILSGGTLKSIQYRYVNISGIEVV